MRGGRTGGRRRGRREDRAGRVHEDEPRRAAIEWTSTPPRGRRSRPQTVKMTFAQLAEAVAQVRSARAALDGAPPMPWHDARRHSTSHPSQGPPGPAAQSSPSRSSSAS